MEVEVVRKLLTLDAYKFSIRLGKMLILTGLSLITSLIVTNYISNNIDDYFSFISKVGKTKWFIIVIAYTLIIQGIILYKITLFNDEKITIKSFFKMIIIKPLPHYTIMLLLMMYVFDIEDVHSNITNNSNRILVVHTIAILIIFYEIVRNVQNLLYILKKSIVDSKDRLTFAIAILATLVSAIALFK